MPDKIDDGMKTPEELRVDLWTEINDYASAWSHPESTSTKRQLAAVCVERAIAALVAEERAGEREACAEMDLDMEFADPSAQRAVEEFRELIRSRRNPPERRKR